MQGNALGLKKLIAFLKRRKWDILLPAVGIFFVAAITARFWPTTYCAASNILNLKSHEETSAEAPRSIENEGKQIQAQLAELDGKIAAFKTGNRNSITEPVRNEQTINQLNAQLRKLREREKSLQNRLAAVSPDLARRDSERLEELLRTYVKLRLQYAEIHPDMVEVKREIAGLKQRVESTRRQTALGEKSGDRANEALAVQLAATRSEIRSIQNQISRAEGKRAGDRERAGAGLWAKEQYKLLLIKRANLQEKLSDQMMKYRNAGGDRFTLIKPAPRNIPLMLLFGFVLGAGAGVGTAFVRELTDKSAYSAADLASATHLNVLEVIPEIVTEKDRKKMMKKQIVLLMIAGAGIICGLLIFIS